MAATPSLSEKNFYLATQNIVQAYQNNSLFRNQFKNSLRLKLANPADRTLDHLLGSRPIESYLWLLGRLSNEPKYFRLLRYTRPDQIDQTILEIDKLFIEFSENKVDREALERLVNGDSSFLTEAEKQSIAQAEGIQDEARLGAYQDLQNKHEAEGLYSNQNNQPALPNIQQFNAGSSQRGVQIVRKAPEPPKQEARRVEMVRRQRIQQKAKELRQSGEITRQPVRSEPAATAPIQRVREPRPLRTPFARRPGGRTFEAAPRRVSTLAQRAQGIRASGALRAAAPALTRTGIGVQNLTRVAGPRAVSGFFGGLGRGALGFLGMGGAAGSSGLIGRGGLNFSGARGRIGRFAGGGGLGGGGGVAKKRVLWLLLLLLFFGMLLGMLGFFDQGSQQANYCPVNAEDVSACKFYNGLNIGLQIGDPAIASFVSDTAAKAGIPATILMGVFRFESPESFAAADRSWFENDYDAHASGAGAVGTMQFLPSTFAGTSMSELAVFGKDSVQSNIIPQEQYNDPNSALYKGKTGNVLRLYSIHDSIIAAAIKLKTDKKAFNGDGPWDEAAIRNAARRYQGGCDNGYCDGLVKSYNSCIASSTVKAFSNTTAVASCPVVNGKIITPSYAANRTTGHCGGPYTSQGLSCRCGVKGKRAMAIDIDTSAGQDVVLPQLGGQNVNWKLARSLCAGGGRYPNCTDSNGGTGGLLTFETVYPGKNDKWYLELLHLDITKISPAIVSGADLPSGTVVGKTDYANHVHASIGVDDGGLPEDCSEKWLPADFMCNGSQSSQPVAQSAIQQSFTPADQTQQSVINNGITIAIDPGHCSNDPYGENKVDENRLNLITAKALEALLKANGFNPKTFDPLGGGKCTEKGSTGIAFGYYKNLQARVNYANEVGANAYISIHADSGVQDDTFNPIYSPIGPFPSESKVLADSIGEEIVKSLNGQKEVTTKTTESLDTGPNRGLDYYVLGLTGSQVSGAIQIPDDYTAIQEQRRMAGVIIENYMKTKPDYSDLYPYTQNIALGYCNGIARFFGRPPCQNIGPGGTLQAGAGNACLPQNTTGNTGGNVFYCQSDPKWASATGFGSCNLASGGCGPTTLAMVLGRFGDIKVPNTDTWGSITLPDIVKGKETIPPTIDSIFTFQKPTWRDCSVGSYMAYVWPWLKSIGYQVTPVSSGAPTIEALAEQIRAGHLIIGSVTSYPTSGGGTVGHIFGISVVDLQSRSLTLFDPANCKAGQDSVRKFDEVSSWGWLYTVAIWK